MSLRMKSTVAWPEIGLQVSDLISIKTPVKIQGKTRTFLSSLDLSIDDYGKDGGPHFTQCMIGICPLATHSYQNLQLRHKILTKATIDLGRRNFVVKSTHIAFAGQCLFTLLDSIQRKHL